MSKIQLSFNILPGNDFVFCRARTIPIKLRDKVKAELQLVHSGKLVKVYSSAYASPIVVALKRMVMFEYVAISLYPLIDILIQNIVHYRQLMK